LNTFDYRSLLIIIICLTLAGSLLSCINQPAETGWHLQVIDPHSEIVYYSLPLKTGSSFTLKYRHSVSGSPVSGTFELTTEGELRPLSTEFLSFGPGLPLDYYEDYKIEKGVITVYHNEEPRREIRLWVTPLTEEVMIIDGQEYPLYIFSDQEKLMVLATVREENLYK
jgi:hypothetical protein